MKNQVFAAIILGFGNLSVVTDAQASADPVKDVYSCLKGVGFSGVQRAEPPYKNWIVIPGEREGRFGFYIHTPKMTYFFHHRSKTSLPKAPAHLDLKIDLQEDY